MGLYRGTLIYIYMRTVTAKIPDDVYGKLMALCGKREVTASEYVRHLIYNSLPGEEPGKPSSSQSKQGKTKAKPKSKPKAKRKAKPKAVDESMVCPVCGRSCDDEDEFLQHMEDKHPDY